MSSMINNNFYYFDQNFMSNNDLNIKNISTENNFKYKILVVEDYDGLRKLVQRELLNKGFESEGAKTGKEAIDWAIKNPNSLIILDYKLPDFNSYDIIKRLNDFNLGIHFIVMTGYGDIRVAVEMMKLGIKDYIIKESDLLELLPASVKRVIDEIANEKKLKAAEEALKSSEESYKLLTDSIKDVIWKADIDFKMTYVSKAVKKLLNYEPEDLINTDIRSLLTKESSNKIETYYFKVLTKIGDIKPIEEMLELEQIKKDGETVWTEISISYLNDKNKNLIGFLGVTRDISERKMSEMKIEQSFLNLRKVLEASIQSMGKAAELKDPYTAGHQRRVGILSFEIAQALGLSQEQCKGIRLAGAIHDIGKIYVPTEILSKPGVLSSNELNIIRTHPEVGYDILKAIEFPWPIAKIVLQHHERLNGSGYPYNLHSDEILLESKIIGIADVIEAMASHRPYRPALGLEKAIDELIKNRNILYDAEIVDVCIDLIKKMDYSNGNFNLNENISF